MIKAPFCRGCKAFSCFMLVPDLVFRFSYTCVFFLPNSLTTNVVQELMNITFSAEKLEINAKLLEKTTIIYIILL
jgi:hypothetical protein